MLSTENLSQFCNDPCNDPLQGQGQGQMYLYSTFGEKKELAKVLYNETRFIIKNNKTIY